MHKKCKGLLSVPSASVFLALLVTNQLWDIVMAAQYISYQNVRLSHFSLKVCVVALTKMSYILSTSSLSLPL